MAFHFTNLPQNFVLRLWAKRWMCLTSDYLRWFWLQNYLIYSVLVIILNGNKRMVSIWVQSRKNLDHFNVLCVASKTQVNYVCPHSSNLNSRILITAQAQLDHKVPKKGDCSPCLKIIPLIDKRWCGIKERTFN